MRVSINTNYILKHLKFDTFGAIIPYLSHFSVLKNTIVKIQVLLMNYLLSKTVTFELCIFMDAIVK